MHAGSNTTVVSLPVVEITDLRTKLKKAQEEGAVAEKQKILGLSVPSTFVVMSSSYTLFLILGEKKRTNT